MRVSHFARIEVIVPPADYTAGADKTAATKTVGMAQNIGIDDNFGTRAENTIGTPLPVLAPGYQQTTINIEKATIDGADFRNLGAFNPLWAHIGKTYTKKLRISDSEFELSAVDKGMYPFMFILRVRNKVSNNINFSNINKDNEAGANGVGNRSNSFGVYACVLQSASISASSQQAVIMDRITAVARPISGTWLSETVKAAFSDSSRTDDFKNGMDQVIYNVIYGYESGA
jgi:hypothetical protein